ncbi:MAG: 6-pyruvoyltetrahydropterin/6-carboxytetrahydropterin synthase [Limisphaerales bacterium]|jgi:6-pyruvoyltetrahydropterin/6-carboxytetrahydropterin synthase
MSEFISAPSDSAGLEGQAKRRVSVFRKARFNAAHRLYRKDWTEEQNTAMFGPCANPNWHGHNYDLHVRVTGQIDPETGYVMDLKVLKDIISAQVTSKFDHKNLNEDVAEFANLNPTAENIVVVIYDLIRQALDTSLDLHVRLYETERNYVEYPAAG